MAMASGVEPVAMAVTSEVSDKVCDSFADKSETLPLPTDSPPPSGSPSNLLVVPGGSKFVAPLRPPEEMGGERERELETEANEESE